MKQFSVLYNTVFAFFFCLQLHCCFAQSFSFLRYGLDEGMPSANAFDITQDSLGYIWCTTEGGLCRFDGKTFQKLPYSNISDTELINAHIDSEGRLWLVDLSSRISYIENDSVYHLGIINNTSDFYQVRILEDTIHRRMWFASRQNLLSLELNDETSTFQTTYHDISQNLNSKIPLMLGDSQFICLAQDGIHFFSEIDWKYEAFKGEADWGNIQGAFLQGDSIIFFDNHQFWCYSISQRAVKPAYQNIVKHIQSRILNIYPFAKDRWWITSFDGLYLVDPTAELPMLHQYFEGKEIGEFIEGHDGSFWFATPYDGLYHLPSLDVKTYGVQQIDQRFPSIAVGKGGVFYGGKERGTIVEYRPGQAPIEHVSALTKLYDLLYVDGQGLYAAGTEHIVLFDRQNKWNTLASLTSYKVIEKDAADNVWVGSSNFAALVKDAQLDKVLGKRTYSLYPINAQEAWIGTVNGLFHYSTDNIQPIPHPKLQQDIRGLTMQGDSLLWVGTQNNGLIAYQSDTIIHHLTVKNGLLTNNCRDLVIGKDYLFVASGKGIARIRLQDLKIEMMTQDNGLPSQEINKVRISEGQVYVATNNGLAVFDEHLKLRQPPPPLHFTSLQVNGKLHTIHSHYKLPYYQNKLRIAYNAITFQHTTDLVYRFKMEGVDKEWTTSDLNAIQYSNLAPGAYQFRLQAKGLNTDWTEEQSFRLTIVSPFWKQWWFYLFEIILAGCLAWLLYQWISQSIKKRNVAREQLILSQLTALRAQMNPHFIFNALNSIQDFILREDKRAANHYLTRFSALMRNILNMSDKKRFRSLLKLNRCAFI